MDRIDSGVIGGSWGWVDHSAADSVVAIQDKVEWVVEVQVPALALAGPEQVVRAA